MVQVRLACEPFMVFTSGMALVGFCYQVNALHSQSYPNTPNPSLWSRFSNRNLMPEITDMAGKGLHLELLKGAKQYSRSVEEPGKEPRCP